MKFLKIFESKLHVNGTNSVIGNGLQNNKADVYFIKFLMMFNH